VPQLGADLRPAVDGVQRRTLDQAKSLLPTSKSRADVERRLQEWPQPPGCPLTLDNGEFWVQKADAALAACRRALDGALIDPVTLLHSDALRQRLAPGQHEPVIGGILATAGPRDPADCLTKQSGGKSAPEPDLVALLVRYLKKLSVRKLCLTVFTPGKRTIELGDVEQITTDFRSYLLDARRGE